MNVFQLVALTIIAVLLVREAFDIARGRRPYRFRLLRGAIWLVTGIAIAFPDLVQDAATFLGIGRGADVVLYSLVFAFLATSFFLYSQIIRQRQQITQLVRHLAIREAQRLDEPATPTKG